MKVCVIIWKSQGSGGEESFSEMSDALGKGVARAQNNIDNLEIKICDGRLDEGRCKSLIDSANQDASIDAIVIAGEKQIPALRYFAGKLKKPIFTTLGVYVRADCFFGNVYHFWGPVIEDIVPIVAAYMTYLKHKHVGVAYVNDEYGNKAVEMFSRIYLGEGIEKFSYDINQKVDWESFKKFVNEQESLFVLGYGSNFEKLIRTTHEYRPECVIYTDTSGRNVRNCRCIFPGVNLSHIQGVGQDDGFRYEEFMYQMLRFISKHAKSREACKYVDMPFGVCTMSGSGQLQVPFNLYKRIEGDIPSIEHELIGKEKLREEIADLLQDLDLIKSQLGNEILCMESSNIASASVATNKLVSKHFSINNVWLGFCHEGKFYCYDSEKESDIGLRFFKEKISVLFCDRRIKEPIQINLKREDWQGNNVLRLFCINRDGVAYPSSYLFQGILKKGDVKKLVLAHSYEEAVSINSIAIANDKEGECIANDYFEESPVSFNDVDSAAFFYYIPEVNVQSADEHGGFFFYSPSCLTFLDLKIVTNIAMRMLPTIHNWLHLYGLKIANTKSAIGSIMSRNGSHNIGSHVLAALSHNVGTMPDDRVLYQYIQHRMDYIATATTDFPSWTYSTPVVSGMMKEFLSQRHLLDYIANSEGLRAYRFQDANMDNSARNNQKNSIRISVSKRTEQNEVVDYITYPYADDNKYRERLANDVSVAIPGGTIGEHAFFTILENVIRNAAKHGWAVRKKVAVNSEKNENATNKPREEVNECDAKGNNLDINVEVLDNVNVYPEDVVVTIWDNISDVFALPDEDKQEEESCRNRGLRKLREWINANKEILRRDLCDLDESGISDESCIEKLKDYFDGNEVKEVDLPRPYCSLGEVLKEPVDKAKKEGLKVWNVLREILIGRSDVETELGRRLWLPMHHRQQLKLETPLIDDTGALRRENWGLAEMKISAGYLQRREIGDIGGIESGKKEQIITAVAREVKGVYHLGYKFKIPRPKELLLALEADKYEMINDTLRIELIKHGIYVKKMAEIQFGEKGLKELSYKYVVLPYFPIENGEPYLPFRVMTRDDFKGNKTAPGGCIVPCIGTAAYEKLIDELFVKKVEYDANPKERAYAILNKVYGHWIDYLVCERRRIVAKGANNYPPLYIQTVDNIATGSNSGSGSAGRCLISDLDIWMMVFSEMFHSVTMNYLKSRIDRCNVDEPLPLGEGWFQFLFFLASWIPKKASLDFVFDNEQKPTEKIVRIMGENRLIAKQLLEWYDDKLCKALSDGLIYDNAGVMKSVRDFAIQARIPEDYITCNETVLQEAVEDLRNFASSNENEKVPENFFDYFSVLKAAFVEADVLLRKYEERIVTLPGMFSAPTDQTKTVKNGLHETISKAIGLNVIINDPGRLVELRAKGKSVDYRRHFQYDNYNANEQLYAESLSGTQTYLNSLFQIKDDSGSTGLVTSLYEAGLMRVLIIDERVADFIRKHDGIAEAFAKMNMWVVDDKQLLKPNIEGTAFTKPEDEMNNVNGLLTFNSKNFVAFRDKFRDAWNSDEKAKELHEKLHGRYVTAATRFDILIIHQGLIDKWFDGMSLSENKMERFIAYWRDIVPYVVITTGRGTPANTPKTARILPFSVVENTLYKKYPEKLVLVDTIMNILPKGDKK